MLQSAFDRVLVALVILMLAFLAQHAADASDGCAREECRVLKVYICDNGTGGEDCTELEQESCNICKLIARCASVPGPQYCVEDKTKPLKRSGALTGCTLICDKDPVWGCGQATRDGAAIFNVPVGNVWSCSAIPQ